MFYSGKMYSDQIDAALTNAVCSEKILDGSLLVLGDLAADLTYDAAGKEYDVYVGRKFATDDKEVVIVDYAGISEGTIMGNDYKMGIKLYDLEVPANRVTRVRRLHLHDKFWLSANNFAATPVAGKYGIPANGSYLHAISNTLPEAGYAIKILIVDDLTTGAKANGKKALCEVVQL